MSEISIASKLINGRHVKEEKIFEKEEGTMPFTAYYKAIDWLIQEGYSYGIMDGNNPVGMYSKDHMGLPPGKWHNLSKEQKDKLVGLVMSSDLRNENVKIVFFED